MSAFVLRSMLWLGLTQPPVLPPEPATPEPTPEPATPEPATPEPEPPGLPPGIEVVEFPLEGSGPSEPLPRMDPSSSRAPQSEQRSVVDLRDPFHRPPLRARSEGRHTLAQQRLLMPDLKDPFADGTRRVRSQTLDLRVPSDLRDPFRDGLGRQRAGACVRTTGDGTPVQAPGDGPRAESNECSREASELHDPFRSDAPVRPPMPNPPHS